MTTPEKLFRRLNHLTEQAQIAKDRVRVTREGIRQGSVKEAERLAAHWKEKMDGTWAEVEAAGLLAEYGEWRKNVG